MSIIVSYVKHWDNDTKGTIEIDAHTIACAVTMAERHLISDALEDSVDPDSDPAALFTITKAEIANSSNWTGVPVARF